MIVFHSSAHQAHAPAHQFDGAGHVIEPYPDVPARVPAIMESLNRRGVASDFREAPPCADRELALVHDPALLEFLRDIFGFYQEATGRLGPIVADTMNLGGGRRAGVSPRVRPRSLLGRLGWYCFDAQTPITQGSWSAARGAASCAISAARAVVGGERTAYALARPPGHHAGADYYGGYCFLNNAALAARTLAGEHGRVALLDVDYHHGNGSQEIFYEDPRVLYLSLHADPDWAYPYFWGRSDERGAGAGAGKNRNFPLPLGTGPAEYLAVLEAAAAEAAAFAPDHLVVSLGTDTYEADPVGTFGLGLDDFARMGERIGGLRLPTVVVHEGGYDVDGIGDCVARFFEGLLGRC